VAVRVGVAYLRDKLALRKKLRNLRRTDGHEDQDLVNPFTLRVMGITRKKANFGKPKLVYPCS